MKPTQLLASLITLSAVTSAWPWPPSIRNSNGLVGIDSGVERRNHHKKSSPQASNTVRPDPSPAGSSSAPENTGKKKPSNTKSDGKHSTTSKVHIPTDAQVGAINIIEPPITSGSQYYRVDKTVTWVWNYTNLVVTPSKIDIVATVSGTSLGVAPSPFTLARNQSFEKTQTFVWDTGKYATHTSPLPVGIYTLLVYDAALEGGASAVPKAGYLAPFNQFQFGMYTSTPFAKPNPPYQCVTCNSANGKHLAFGFLFGMVALSMGSFLWFAGLNGVF